MAKAIANLEDVELFERSVRQSTAQMSDLCDDAIDAIGAWKQDIAKEGKRIQVVCRRIETRLVELRQIIADLNEQIDECYATLATMEPFIEVTTVDLDDNETTTYEPNPTYEAMRLCVHALKATRTGYRDEMMRLEQLITRANDYCCRIAIAIEKLDALESDVKTELGNNEEHEQRAVMVLHSIQVTLGDYLSVFIGRDSAVGSVGWGGSPEAGAGGLVQNASLRRALRGVPCNPIHPAASVRTEQEIISDISGGDMTDGSCSSLAFAYAGNKAGYEVYDFRDGQSRKVFSSMSAIEQIARLDGVFSRIVSGKDDTVCAEQLMTTMQPGKEYYLATGQHAAVVRLSGSGQYQYLELQSANPSVNGWQPLTLSSLYVRFGCEDGQMVSYSNCLIDLDSLQNSKEFLNVLGYINTAKSAQMKGVSGHVR